MDVLILNKVIPHLLALNVLAGKKNVAFAVVDLEDFNLDLVTNIYYVRGVDIRIGRKLAARNEPIRLVTDVYAHFAVNDLHH